MFTPGIGAHAKALFRLLPADVRSFAIIGGGALRCFFDKTPMADIDLLFRNEEAFQAAIKAFSETPGHYFIKHKGRSEVWGQTGSNVEFNLIGFCFGTAQETIERFDFRCCRMAAFYNENCGMEFVSDPHAVSDAVTKSLIVLVNNGTERTLMRIAHYVDDYGYVLDLDVDEHLVAEPEPDEESAELPPTRVSTYISRLPRCGSGGY